MKATATQWLSNQAYELFEQYSEGNFDRITLNKLMLQATEQAKEMEKEQIIKAHGVKFDYSYSQIDPKKITGEQYYEQIYGGNK